MTTVLKTSSPAEIVKSVLEENRASILAEQARVQAKLAYIDEKLRDLPQTAGEQSAPTGLSVYDRHMFAAFDELAPQIDTEIGGEVLRWLNNDGHYTRAEACYGLYFYFDGHHAKQGIYKGVFSPFLEPVHAQDPEGNWSFGNSTPILLVLDRWLQKRYNGCVRLSREGPSDYEVREHGVFIRWTWHTWPFVEYRTRSG